jgi:hypothetical protein
MASNRADQPRSTRRDATTPSGTDGTPKTETARPVRKKDRELARLRERARARVGLE